MKIQAIGHLLKANPNKPNFKRGNDFSPQGVPGTAYYTRDCHVAEFTLSASVLSIVERAEGSKNKPINIFAWIAQPEKNFNSLNLLATKSYRIYLNCVLLSSNLVVFVAVL